MANISREERMRREAERSEERKQRLDAATTGDAQTARPCSRPTSRTSASRWLRATSAARVAPRDRLPATMTRGMPSSVDERRPPGDVGKAQNQMVGRAAIAQEMRPDAYLFTEEARVVQNPNGPMQGQEAPRCGSSMATSPRRG
jgi:hypothetical protein